MTLGGIWALVPDLPRVLQEFPSLVPRSYNSFAVMKLEIYLHQRGDMFFFHRFLDNQPNELAVVGFAVVVALYNVVVLPLAFGRHRRD
jgi:hypothetical protein